MADTGWVIAGTGANSDDGGNAAWSFPTRITADDASYTTAAIPAATNTSQLLRATNFGFAVPADATIDGVQVRVQRYKSAGAGSINEATAPTGVQLIKGGTAQGNINDGPVWPTTPTDQDYGGAADLWSVTLTPTDVNAANFGAQLKCRTTAAGAADASVDAIWIKVTYTSGTVALTANDLIAGTPALDNPALAQVHALVASGIAAAALLDSPPLGQAHVLSANDLQAAAPALEAPPLTVIHPLTGSDLFGGAWDIDSPPVAQVSVLAANDLFGGAWALDNPALAQAHALAASKLFGGAWLLDSPPVAQVHPLGADDLVFGAWALDNPALAQVHVLTIAGLLLAAAVLGHPALIGRLRRQTLVLYY